MRKRWLIPILVAAAVVVCVLALDIALRLPERAYPLLGEVTRIEVKGPEGESLRVIHDQEMACCIAAYIDSHQSGWGINDWGGVPVPQITAYLYKGEMFKGHFGVGPGFFETQREGTFASKAASRQEEQHFLEMLGLPGYQLQR